MRKYTHSTAYVVTREAKVRQFINAKDEYAKYRAFMDVLEWMDATQELMWYLKNEEINE
jgi:hypothetical protein